MIEAASWNDAETILQVINTSNREAYKCIIPKEYFQSPILSAEDMQELFGRMTFYVYRLTGQVVGVAALSVEGRGEGRIRWVYILPEFKRKGIGTALVRYVENVAQKKGLKRLSVLTSGAAIWAIEFYQKLGYHLADKVDRPWGFDVLMERALIEGTS